MVHSRQKKVQQLTLTPAVRVGVGIEDPGQIEAYDA